jgi:hypothetical protein
MLDIRKKTVVLGLTVLLIILTLIVPAFADLSTFTGEITRIEGKTITLNGYKKFEPANERARLPEWAAMGTTVKVGYYTQNKINYYQEIAKPGKMLKVEKREAWSSRTNE